MSNNIGSNSEGNAGRNDTNLRRKFAAKWIQVVGTAEGLSFLLLLFIAMPAKYVAGKPELVHFLGPVHGGLFLLYVASAIAVARILGWRWVNVPLALVASVIPFGPFLFEAWLRREATQTA